MHNLFKKIIGGSKAAFARFPVSMAYSILTGFVLIFLIENENELSTGRIESLAKAAMVLGMGILLFLALKLGFDSFESPHSVRITGYLAGVAAQIGYFYILLREMNMVSVTRYMGTLLLLFMLVMFLPRIRRPEGIVGYVKGLAYSFSLAAVYAAVLFIGLVVIVFTLEQLFQVPFKESIYVEMFILVVFVFAASMFLSRIPDREALDQVQYSTAARILLEYIVIPLIFIYSAILYVYFVKIIATWDWPKGLVSHLVLWYSVFATGLIFISSPLEGKSRTIGFFNRWFPRINLPILVMMFLSMGQRILQYGITENRYFVVAMGAWVLLAMMNYSLRNRFGNISVLVAFAIIVTISLYGPASAYSVSMRSQNNRLSDILEDYQMLSEGVIVPGTDVDEKDRREINNILYYFQQNHSLEDVKVLPESAEPDNLSAFLGFDYEPYTRGDMSGRFNIYLQGQENYILEVTDYDYYFSASSWNQGMMESGQIGSRFTKGDNMLEIFLNGEAVFSESLLPMISEIVGDSGEQLENSSTRNQNQMTYDFKNDNITVRIIFESINGTYKPGSEPEISSMEFKVLLRIQ